MGEDEAMRFATLCLRPADRQNAEQNGTVAARIEQNQAVLLEDFPDVGALLRAGALGPAATQNGQVVPLEDAHFAPVVTAPDKIFCVGMNFRSHIREMGRPLPSYPTLFAKWQQCLAGASDPILLPSESTQVDWEGELVAVVGKNLRRADLEQARSAITGYTLMCDTSMRDWQYRTSQWLQGKSWERSTPLGPWMSTADELPDDAELTTKVDGQCVQRGRISDLLFSPEAIVSYISTFITLHPGDLIATGTPGGVGHAMNPPNYLRPGQTVTVEVTGVGVLESKVESELIWRHD